MNRHIMGCVFVIALLPLFVGDAVASPSMLFSPNEVDFGQRSHIDVFTQEVEITNSGTTDLHILRVSRSCNCLLSELSKDTIPPKGKARLKMVFDMKGRLGAVRESLLIETNDPTNKRVLLNIKGEGVEKVKVSPWPPYLGKVSSDKRTSASITLQGGANLPDLKVREVSSDSPYFQFQSRAMADKKTALDVT